MEVVQVVQDVQRGSITALECNKQAIFAGTSSGFVLRYPCTSFDLGNPSGSTSVCQGSGADAHNVSANPKLKLQVERSVGDGLLPLASVKCCPRGEVIAALCRSNVYLFRESDLHPLHAIGSQPFATLAISISFNERPRGVCDTIATSHDAADSLPRSGNIPVSSLCIERSKELSFFKIPTRSVENSKKNKTPTAYARLAVDPDLDTFLWIGDRVVLVYRNYCTFRSLADLIQPRTIRLSFGCGGNSDGASDVCHANRALLMGSNEIAVISGSCVWQLRMDGLGSAKAHAFGKPMQLHGCCLSADGVFLLSAPPPNSSSGPLGGRIGQTSGTVERVSGWELCWSATVEGGRHLVCHGSQAAVFCSVGQSIAAVIPTTLSLELPKVRQIWIQEDPSDGTNFPKPLASETSIVTPKLPRNNLRAKMHQTVKGIVSCNRGIERVAGIEHSPMRCMTSSVDIEISSGVLQRRLDASDLTAGLQSALDLLEQSGGECLAPKTANMFVVHVNETTLPKASNLVSTWQMEIFLRSNGRSMDWTGDLLQASEDLVCSLCVVRGEGLERVSEIKNIALDPLSMSKNGCLALNVRMTVHGSAEDRRKMQLVVRTGRSVTEFLPMSEANRSPRDAVQKRSLLGMGVKRSRASSLNDARRKSGGFEEVQYVEPCTYSIVRIFTTSGLGINTKNQAPSPIHVRPSSSSGDSRDFRTWEVRGSDVGVHVRVSQAECTSDISIYDQEEGVILADHCELPWLGTLEYVTSTGSPNAPDFELDASLPTGVCPIPSLPEQQASRQHPSPVREFAAASCSLGLHPMLALSPLCIVPAGGSGKTFLVTATILAPGNDVSAHTFTITGTSNASARPGFLQEELLFPIPEGLRHGARLYFNVAYIKHRSSLLRPASRSAKEIVSFGSASLVLHDGVTSTIDGLHTIVIESQTNTSKGHGGMQNIGKMQVSTRLSGFRTLEESNDTAIANFCEAVRVLKQAWREQGQDTEQTMCHAIAAAASLRAADPVQLRLFCSRLADSIWGIASAVCIEDLSGRHHALSLCTSLLHIIVIATRLSVALGAPALPPDRSMTTLVARGMARTVELFSRGRLKNATEVMTAGFRLLLGRGGGQARWWWPGATYLFQLLSRNSTQQIQTTTLSPPNSPGSAALAETLKEMICCLQPPGLPLGTDARSVSRQELNQSITDCILSFCEQSCKEGNPAQALDVVTAYLSAIHWSEWRVRFLHLLALSPFWHALNATDRPSVANVQQSPASGLDKNTLASSLIDECVRECITALRHSHSERLVPSSAVAALCEVLQIEQENGTGRTEEVMAMYLPLLTWCVDHKAELELWDSEFEQRGGREHRSSVAGVASCFISLTSGLTPTVSVSRTGHAGCMTWDKLVQGGYGMSGIIDTVRVCLQIILRQACECGVSGASSVRESQIAREWRLHSDKADGPYRKTSGQDRVRHSDWTKEQVGIAEGALALWVGRPAKPACSHLNVNTVTHSVLQKAFSSLRKHRQVHLRQRHALTLASSIRMTMLVIERFTGATLGCPTLGEKVPPHGLIEAGWESIIRMLCTALEASPSAHCCIDVIAVTLRCLQHSNSCLQTCFSHKQSNSGESTSCESESTCGITASMEAGHPLGESERVGQGLGVELVLVVLKRMSYNDKRVRDGALLVLLAMLKGAVEIEGSWERLEGAFGAALAEAVEVLDREESLLLSQSLEAAAEILTCTGARCDANPTRGGQEGIAGTPLKLAPPQRDSDIHSEQPFSCSAEIVSEIEVDGSEKVVGLDGGVTLPLRPRADVSEEIVTGANEVLRGTVWSSSAEGCDDCWCEEMAAVSRFVSESKEFVKRHLIFRTIEKEDANYDVVADAMSGVIEVHNHQPTFRVMWLWKLLRFHRSKGGNVEAAQCAQELSQVVEAEVMAMEKTRRVQVGLLVGSTGTELDPGFMMTANFQHTGRQRGAPPTFKFGSSVQGPSGFDGTVDLARIGMDSLEMNRACKAKRPSSLGLDRVGAELFGWRRLAQCYREEAKLMAVAGRVEGAYAAERRLLSLLDKKGRWDGIEKAHVRASGLARQCEAQASMPPGAASSKQMYLVRYEGPAFGAREGMEYVYLAPQFCQIGEFAEQLAVQAQGLLSLPSESLHSTCDSRYSDLGRLSSPELKAISVQVLIGTAPAKAGGKAFLRVQTLTTVKRWHHEDGSFEGASRTAGKGSSAQPVAADRFFYDLPALASGEVGRSVLLREQWKLRTTVRVRNNFPFRTRRQLVLEKSSVLVHPMLGASEALTERAMDVVAACSMTGDGKTKELERLLVGTLIVQVNAGPLALIETFSAPPPSTAATPVSPASMRGDVKLGSQLSPKKMAGLRRKFLECVEEFTSTCELGLRVYADDGGGGILLEELQIGMQQLRRASAQAKRGLREQEKLPATPRVIVHRLEQLSASDEVSEDEDEDIEEASDSESSEAEFAENEMLVLSGSGCWT